MDRLSVLWEKFSLSESEGSKYVVEECVTMGEFFIAAHFFTGIGMHRRMPESDFQVQLDAIDTELTKFDTGKGVGMDCGIGQEHHVDVHNGATLNSLTVDFIKDSDGFSQQQGSNIRGTGRARVSKRPKRLINEDSVMTTGSKRSVLSKRSHKEIDSEVGIEVGCKKSRNADISDLSVEAGFHPHREQ